MIGFGTGCLYKNFNPLSKEAMEIVRLTGCKAIELCAVKPERIDYANNLPVNLFKEFSYTSLHAPDIEYQNDSMSLEILQKIQELYEKFNFKTIVVCPNFVKDFSVFRNINFPLSFENMDKRKDFGASVNDMKEVFEILPNAKFVLDLTHIYTNDKSMKLAKDFYEEFKDRLIEIHLSGYFIHTDGDEQQHYPLSVTKQKEILTSIPLDKPIIIESVFPACESENKKERMIEQLKEELNYITENK